MSLNNPKKPLILKKMIVKPNSKLQVHHIKSISGTLNVKGRVNHNNTLNSQFIKLAAIPLFREDVIFESKGESYIPGEYRSVTIINKLNNLTNNCTTIAKCVTLDDKTVEKTSDNLTTLIGHEAYNTLFYALCSVINQEYRIKGILALLTVYNPPVFIPTADVKKVETGSQTDEIRLDTRYRYKKKRVRKVLAPHIVKPEDYTKKYIVDPRTGIAREAIGDIKPKIKPKVNPPADILKFEVDEKDLKETEDKLDNLKRELVENELPPGNCILPDNSMLQELGCFQDDSNDSIKTMSALSFQTMPGLLTNPLSVLQMGANIDKHIKEIPEHKFPIMLADGSEIKLIHKPEDIFHIATKENLEFLNEEDRKKLVFHQLEIDKQHCCTSRDDDGNLPIHLAIINEDIELLKRHCVVLRMQGESVDIPANNGLTALKLAIDYHTSPHSVPMLATLLQNGADPLLVDAEQHSCSVHRAAELNTDHLALILHWATARHREIIMDNEDLQQPGWQEKPQEELIDMLLKHICNLFDKQGYNPLMLACKHGHYENVKLLLEAVPTSVNLQNPNSGNTALFIAVAAACNVAAERGNKSKIVDHFKKTIEILLDYSADPQIENHTNINVNLLLSEFGCTELSNLVLNKIANQKFFGGDMDPTKNFHKYHLVKEGKTVTIQEFKNKSKNTLQFVRKTVPIKHDGPLMVKCFKKGNLDNKIINNVAKDKKPVIVENILLKSSANVMEKPNDLNKVLLKSQVKEGSLLIGEKVNSKDFVLKTPAKECKVTLKRKTDVANTHGKKQKNK